MDIKDAILEYREAQKVDGPNSHLTLGKFWKVFGEATFTAALNAEYDRIAASREPNPGWCYSRTSDGKLCPIQEDKPGSKQCRIHRQQSEVV